MSNKYIRVLLPIVFLVALALVNVFIWAIWDESFISHDGIQYLSTAANLVNGRGLSTGSLLYTGHYQSVLPAPQTIWPPGFSLLIGLLSSAGMETLTAALAIELIAHSGSAVCIFFILLRCGIGATFAVALAAGFMFLVLPWKYATQLLSDPLMNFLMLAILAIVPTFDTVEASDKKTIFLCLICAVFCAGLLITRYSAFLFVASTILVAMFASGSMPFFRTKAARNKSVGNFSLIAILISLPVVTFAVVMYRNNRLTGTLLPNNGINEPLSLTQTIKKFYDAITGFLGIDNAVLPDLLNSAISILILLFTIVLIIYSLYLLRKPSITHRSTSVHRYRSKITAIVLLHTLLFIAYFTYKSITPGFPELLPRYLLQIAGGFYVLIGMLAASAWQKTTLSGSPRNANWLIFLLTLIFFLVQIGQINAWAQFNRIAPRHQMVSSILESEVSEGRSLAALIQECYREDPISNSLWSNEGQLLHLYTDVTTLTLPEKNRFLPEYDKYLIAKHIETYNVKMLALIESEYRKDNIHPLNTFRTWFQEMGFHQLYIDTGSAGAEVRAEVYIVDQKCL